MELRHLRYFQAVAEELSYTKASRRLRVAQPALSRVIKEIESELGAVVLERSTSRVRLTQTGEVLLKETALLLERWEEAFRKVRRTASGEEGELRLGYIGPPTEPFLGRLLGEYRRRYPRVSLHLEERTPERVWEMVAKGRLSLGLTRPVPLSRDLGLQTLELRAERLGVVVPEDHAFGSLREVDWAALEREPLVILARREGVGLHDAVLSGCRSAGFAPKIAQTPSLIGTVLSYVEAGIGVGVVTEAIVRPGHPLRFVPLSPTVRVPLVLVWQADGEPEQVSRFRDLLGEWLAAGLLWE
ncbi:MAG: LysR family transcriptional regulator [Verrucomicrobia bacterium]|nr:LysR family transcriptional regulator [Verrucomicrobiota bacterium]